MCVLKIEGKVVCIGLNNAGQCDVGQVNANVFERNQ